MKIVTTVLEWLGFGKAKPDTLVPAAPPPPTQANAPRAEASQPPIQAGAAYCWWEQAVDIDALVQRRAATGAPALNWESSIADLLKLLGQAHDPEARMTLARQMAYPAEADDSTAMRDWLLKTLRQKLDKRAGKTPPP